MRDSTIGFGALSLASAIWGGMYVASDALMRTMPPLVAVEFREVISAALLLGIAAAKGALRIERRDLAPMIGVGIIGFSISKEKK
jgi:drug/metabolite transporter (DMT)-like permease